MLGRDADVPVLADVVDRSPPPELGLWTTGTAEVAEVADPMRAHL
ncbi:hypothetical protein [Microlunatus flavus]|nr:hypothetical protein [Microlunatus flavus]